QSALAALVNGAGWAELAAHERWADDPVKIAEALAAMLRGCDLLMLTGGVSMGDRDHVPQIVVQLGGETIFHKLPIRPGKPLLGAIGPQGQAILGLPGNPVSALVCGCRFG